MKKLAMNFLKTADEKLRNIGKHHPATVVQTQNFTFYKSQAKQDSESPAQAQQPLHQQPTQPLEQPQLPDQEETTGGERHQPKNEPNTEGMAERALLRHGRRERNGLRPTGEVDTSDFKRRSRSEGPNRRVRQSMDEREGGKKQTYDGGGRNRRLDESSESDDVDRNVRQTTGFGAYESDSDSDPKKWTKNPLVVRRAKRSDKTKQVEKRSSGIENGDSAKNRDSFTYYSNDVGSGRTGNQSGGNSSSRDSGSSTKGSSKYQKLEELRKKRINLAVTSDEEATPASRISRLRQRALQGALGDQSRSSTFHDSVQWDDEKRLQQQRAPQHSVFSDPGNQKLNDSSSEVGHFSSAPERPQYGPRITPVNQPPSFVSQSFIQGTPSVKPTYSASVAVPRQGVQSAIAKQSSSSADGNLGFNQQLSRIQPKLTSTPQNQPQKIAPARPPPPNLTGARQSIYTSQEPTTTQTNSALINSSPEVTARRFTNQVRIPSVDSIVTSAPKTSNSGNSNQPITFATSLRQIQARGSPTPNQELFKSIASSSQVNDVVEMRLKTTRDGRIEPHHKIPKRTLAKSSFAYSDDTLDELVESNIQYLDSDLDKAKNKRNSSSGNVSRSSSLPDPRRISSYTVLTPNHSDQPSIQVQANTSIQFHVSLPTDPRNSNSGLGAPIIQIAPSNSFDYQSDYALDSSLRSQPDVVPRKYSYDSRSRISRPNSEYFDRDDMSKSDTQLNAQVIIPSYLGNNLHPDQAYARGCVSDMNLRSDVGSSLHAPQMDKGMFSDVEYDIEVSERVKKWETFMKDRDGQISSEKKNINLTTIQENNESDALMLPSEIRKTVLLSKNGAFGPSYTKDVSCTSSARSRPFSSDTSLYKAGDADDFKMFSMETNANRFFQVVQDPEVGPRLSIQSLSVASLFHTPNFSRPETGFLSASELRQKMLANRQPALPISSGPVQATFQPKGSEYALNDMAPMARSSLLSDYRGMSKRASRYTDELDEISNVKTDSVISLRRRFDTDSATATSEDDHRSVSTASAKLSRPSDSPSRRGSDSVDWSSVMSGYESKLKDSDVWSPNLESTHGVPVSIERVTARTLQTIPFSEDPFWKEIEEMTSFDPNSMAGHLSVGKGTEPVDEQTKSQHHVEMASPHSSTLPNQPRISTMPLRERMQRSKSLYTPNITPLSINVADKTPSSAVSALDEVLEDISRSSIERKQLSPKKKAFETDNTTSSSSTLSNTSNYLKGKQDQAQPGFKFEGGHFTFMKSGGESSQPQMIKPNAVSGNRPHEHSERLTMQTKQPLQFYNQLRQQSQKQAENNQSQAMQGNVNNYHLDPNLLKQKLLSTGLVVETDTEEPITYKQSRSSSLGSTVTINLVQNGIAPSFVPISSQPSTRVKSDELVKPVAIYATSQSESSKVNTTAPWAAKQSGSSALDNIQKALAPFQSTSYQPGPETLYGTSRLQSFNEPSFSTSKGPNTTATSWTYQPKLKTNTDRHSGSESSTNSLTRLQQVNASMDDLQDLAQTVERKINAIKGKLQTADEKSLDSILASLRKLSPEVRSQESEPIDVEEYYTTKKTKLSDALVELNRIYNDLELGKDNLGDYPQRGKQKPYRSSKSSDFFLEPQPKAEKLHPVQTRISSVFIPGLEIKTRSDLDKETESEFDILSKSFQAIVDEVNQTTGILSRAAESNRHENMAPETQKVTTKIALRTESAVPAKTLVTSSTDDVFGSKAPPATAPKPQEMKPKFSRFRAKLQENLADNDSSIKRARSKSVPSLDSNTQELLEAAIENGNSSVSVSLATASTTGSSADLVTASAASRQRTRVRPVRDNKIIQDDKAAKKQGCGVTQSPQPSPIGSRKIIYNCGLGSDVNFQSTQSPRNSPEDASPETNITQQHITLRPQADSFQDKHLVKSVGNDPKLASISSPASQKKIPPPTAAKPGARLDASSTSSAEMTSSMIVTSKSHQVPTYLHLTTNKLELADSHTNRTGQVHAVTSAKITLTSPVSENNQSKLFVGGSKPEDDASGGGQRSRRRLGTGVAFMLDKFNTSEDGGDRIKKQTGARSAPDLIESLNGADDCGEEDIEAELQRKPTLIMKMQPQLPTEHKESPPKNVKTPSQRIPEKKIPVLASLSKSSIVTSLERKVIDPEGKTPSSGNSSPQPSSPVSRPPQHPWKRLTSDPDKQNTNDALEASITSPKFVSKIPRPVTANRSTTGCISNDESPTSKESEKLQQKVGSPRVLPRRVRPPNRKMQTQTIRDRPHSFHELISCFDKDPNRLQTGHKFRKYASADEVNSETLVNKVFRAETAGYMSDGSGSRRGAVLKLQMKLKS